MPSTQTHSTPWIYQWISLANTWIIMTNVSTSMSLSTLSIQHITFSLSDSFLSYYTLHASSLSESINARGTKVIPKATTSLPAICRKVWLRVPLLLKAYFFLLNNHSALRYNHHQIPLFGSECALRTHKFDFLRAMTWDYMEHTSTSYTIIR